MLKERIQEVLEFSKSESPYRKANKGWLNQDIFLDLNPSSNPFKKREEVAKVTLLWSPINSLLSNIFFVIIIGSILVFTSLSFVKGRIDLNLFNTSMVKSIVKVEENISINQNILQDKDSSEIEKNIVTDKTIKSSERDLSDDLEITLDKNVLNTKIYNQETPEKDLKDSKDITLLKKNKPKSNFF